MLVFKLSTGSRTTASGEASLGRRVAQLVSLATKQLLHGTTKVCLHALNSDHFTPCGIYMFTDCSSGTTFEGVGVEVAEVGWEDLDGVVVDVVEDMAGVDMVSGLHFLNRCLMFSPRALLCIKDCSSSVLVKRLRIVKTVRVVVFISYPIAISDRSRAASEDWSAKPDLDPSSQMTLSSQDVAAAAGYATDSTEGLRGSKRGGRGRGSKKFVFSQRAPTKGEKHVLVLLNGF